MLVASICLSSYRPFEVSRECSFVESEAFLLMEQAESVQEAGGVGFGDGGGSGLVSVSGL